MKLIKKSLCLILAFALAASFSSATLAKAATKKGAVCDFTVSGGWGMGSVCFWLGEETYTTDLTQYKESFTAYIPKSALEKDAVYNFSPSVSFEFDGLQTGAELFANDEEHIAVSYDGKDIKIESPVTGSETPISSTDPSYPYNVSASVEGDMIKLVVTDISISGVLSAGWDDETETDKEWTGPLPEVGDVNPKVSYFGVIPNDVSLATKIVFTDVSITAGDKSESVDFARKDAFAYWSDSMVGKEGEIKPASFSTSYLSIAKSNVKVKAKKSVSVKATTMFSGDKVTVKTSSKKVATASYKNGKITIKGKKKGKATITVKANGVSKKIKVTVKK